MTRKSVGGLNGLQGNVIVIISYCLILASRVRIYLEHH